MLDKYVFGEISRINPEAPVPILDVIKKPEIVIIDDNSQDNTINIVKYFIQDSTLKDNVDSNFTDIKIFNITDYSPGKSLNLGIIY